jgi:hypothetical protein
VEVDSLAVEKLVQVKDQRSLSLLRVGFHQRPQSIAKKPFAPMLVSPQEVQDRLLVIDVLVDVLVKWLRKDLSQKIQHFVTLRSVAVERPYLVYAILSGILCVLHQQ